MVIKGGFFSKATGRAKMWRVVRFRRLGGWKSSACFGDACGLTRLLQMTFEGFQDVLCGMIFCSSWPPHAKAILDSRSQSVIYCQSLTNDLHTWFSADQPRWVVGNIYLSQTVLCNHLRSNSGVSPGSVWFNGWLLTGIIGPIGSSSESSCSNPMLNRRACGRPPLSFAGVVDATWVLVGFYGGIFLDVDVWSGEMLGAFHIWSCTDFFPLVRFHDM